MGAADQGIKIVIDADTELGEIYSFWNVFPVTVQAPFKDKDKHEELRRNYPYAKYINCVRFLGGIKLEKDDYFRGVDADGRAVCDFTEAVALLSGIRQCGFTPWIVLDNVPAAMCKAPTKNKYGNTEPPADFKVWTSYVRRLVPALVDEFGLDDVSGWRFRVGTEPDLKPGHWSGTKEEYFEHYDHTVAAVLSVVPDMEKERARMGEDANVYAVAMRVMAANRAKYASMSRLSELEPLPELSVDDLGRIHFDLSLEGHSVINLRLE